MHMYHTVMFFGTLHNILLFQSDLQVLNIMNKESILDHPSTLPFEYAACESSRPAWTS